MPRKPYKVGDRTSTGHEIAEILGQSPRAFIYTSADNQLRWDYYGDHGQLRDEQGIIVAKFDTFVGEADGEVLM